ncbi:MAG: PEGA domain-containing protein [Myxococcota bacterium]
MIGLAWLPAASATPPPLAGVSDGSEAQMILVLPVQPIFRSAETAKAEAATAILVKELSRSDDILVLSAVSPHRTPKGVLEADRHLRDAAQSAETERRIAEAIQHRQALLTRLESNIDQRTDADISVIYVAAHHELARALTWGLRDAHAEPVLLRAASLNPTLELPAAHYSRLYRARFRDALLEAEKGPRAEVLVRSVLPGLPIELDGRPMGEAPLLLENVLPGRHVLTATSEVLGRIHRLVDVGPNRRVEVTMASERTSGGQELGMVSRSVAENTLSSEAVRSAQTLGRAAGAHYVLITGMARVLDIFKVHPFLVSVHSGRLATIRPQVLDLALLTAGSDLGSVVSSVERATRSFEGSSRSMSSIEPSARFSAAVRRVDAEPAFKAAPETPEQSTPRRKRPVRAVRDLDLEQ